MAWIFTKDDYIHTIKRQKPIKCKQSIIPKQTKNKNKSIPIPGKHQVIFKKAKELI